jgi:hypothetical protein
MEPGGRRGRLTGWGGTRVLRRIPRRHVLLATVLGSLLVLAGLLPSGDGSTRAGALRGPSTTAGPPAAMPVPLAPTGPGVRAGGRPAPERAVLATGSRLAAFTAGRLAQLVERAGPVQHRTSPGPGDHLAMGPAAGGLVDFALAPASPGRVPAPAPSTPRAAFGARAPPVP